MRPVIPTPSSSEHAADPTLLPAAVRAVTELGWPSGELDAPVAVSDDGTHVAGCAANRQPPAALVQVPAHTLAVRPNLTCVCQAYVPEVQTCLDALVPLVDILQVRRALQLLDPTLALTAVELGEVDLSTLAHHQHAARRRLAAHPSRLLAHAAGELDRWMTALTSRPSDRPSRTAVRFTHWVGAGSLLLNLQDLGGRTAVAVDGIVAVTAAETDEIDVGVACADLASCPAWFTAEHAAVAADLAARSNVSWADAVAAIDSVAGVGVRASRQPSG